MKRASIERKVTISIPSVAPFINRGENDILLLMQKILLYYKFTPITDAKAVMLWQKTLTDSLNLRGRILVSHQGINGTVGGTVDELKAYIKATKQYPQFHDIVFKWSDGGADDFPRMS